MNIVGFGWYTKKGKLNFYEIQSLSLMIVIPQILSFYGAQQRPPKHKMSHVTHVETAIFMLNIDAQRRN